jgi:hypothetical protein
MREEHGVMRSSFALTFALVLAACGDDRAIDPCAAMECPLPAPPRCEGATLVVTAFSTCVPDAGAPECRYTELRTDCAAAGLRCAEGNCHPR